MPRNLTIQSASAKLLQNDDGLPYVEVELHIGGQTVTAIIHQSLVYADTINVELNGDFSEALGLRVNLNDGLMYDSIHHSPALPDDREPNLTHDEDDDEPIGDVS